jgi:hypothetical protein
MPQGFEIAEAYVSIKGDKGKFNATIRGAKRETAGFANSAAKSLKQVGIGLGVIAAAASAAAIAIGVKLARAIVRVGRATIRTAVTYDKLKRGLVAVAGSALEAERQLIRLQKVAELPGLSFRQAIQGSINLQAAGLSAQLAERALKAFGNALVTVGKGAEDLGGVNLALTQIANKTSGFGQDVRQLQERLPQMQTALKNAFDGKPLEDLEITGKELVAALVTEFEKLPKASGGIANSIENIGIAFEGLKDDIGRTLIPATDKVIKSLTGIIDKLRLVVRNYDVFKVEVSQIMIDISVIGIKMTGKMLEGMAKIISIAGKTIWQPLLTGFKIALLEIVETSLPLSNVVTVLKRIPKVGDDIERAYNKAVAPIREFIDSKQSEMWAASMSGAAGKIATATEEVGAELRAMFAALLAGLSQTDSKLGTVADKMQRIEQFKAGIKEVAAGFMDMFSSETVQRADGLAAILTAMPDVLKGNIRAVLAVGDAFRFAIEEGAAPALERAAEVAKGLSDATNEMAEKIKEQMQGAVNTIQPAFENMFANLFSGNTKSLWEEFWTDLKRIAIRQMAAIFATQLLGGLLTGGASLGGGGLLAGIGAGAASNFGRGFGGAGRAAGRLMEGGVNIGVMNVQDQDLRNFDKQRLTKQVEQGIAPALAEAAADGI